MEEMTKYVNFLAKSNKKMKIRKYFSILLLPIAFLFSCNSSPDSDYNNSIPKTEAELKRELLNIECQNAESYLEGTLKYKPIYKNPLSNKVKGLKITCDIKSNATLVTLKDIKAKVIFESKTGAKIIENTFDIYEFIGPKSTFKYKTEIELTNQQYKDISKFNWTVISAACK